MQTHLIDNTSSSDIIAVNKLMDQFPKILDKLIQIKEEKDNGQDI